MWRFFFKVFVSREVKSVYTEWKPDCVANIVAFWTKVTYLWPSCLRALRSISHNFLHFIVIFLSLFRRVWGKGRRHSGGRSQWRRGGPAQGLPAVPAGLRLLQERRPLRGPGGQHPAAGRAVLPVSLLADCLRQHDPHLPLPQEQGARPQITGADSFWRRKLLGFFVLGLMALKHNQRFRTFTLMTFCDWEEETDLCSFALWSVNMINCYE